MYRRKKSKSRFILYAALSVCIMFLAGRSLSGQESGRDEEKDALKSGREQAEGAAWQESDKYTADEETEPETEQADEEIQELISSMSLEDKVSQLFFVNPEALTGAGTVSEASGTIKSAMESCTVGGIILFSANIKSEEQLRTMTSNLHSYSKYPLFLGVDEEGGRVARIADSGVINVPVVSDMQEIGNTQDPEQAYQVGVTIGRYVKDLGFNVDFAPVADVVSNPANQVIGPRSFGSDASLAARMVAREVQGMQEQGVSASLKHFPGHGDAIEDSHSETAVLNKTADELRSMEFLPFKAGIEAGADMVMTGHISVPAITGDNVPASLSEQIVTGYLRGELGFQGIVVTDAMNMGAVVKNYTSAEAAVKALQAGCDMILMPQDFFEARQAVLDAVNNSVILEERIDESLRRIFQVKLQRRQPV